MKHIAQQSIDSKIRRPCLQRWRQELRTALQNPALPPEQRKLLEERLARAGQPRIYRADDPAPPGAIDSGPMPTKPRTPKPVELVEFSYESLAQKPKVMLLAYAAANDIELEPACTKAQVIQAILACCYNDYNQTKEMDA